MFHINACSLNKNFEDLQHLLKCTKKNLMLLLLLKLELLEIPSNYVTLISRMIQLSPLQPKHQLEEHYSIANHLSYKPRNDR